MILRPNGDRMAELCEHQKISATWTVEVRPPEYECIFCHVDRLEALLDEQEDRHMKRDDRKRLADFMRGRAHSCHEEAIKNLEEAIVTMRDPMGDMEAVEESIGKALTHVGEARGFVNAASDVQEKEDQ